MPVVHLDSENLIRPDPYNIKFVSGTFLTCRDIHTNTTAI